MKKYTHNNNELNKSNINKEVYLKGWVAKKRNLGGLIFIDLRDKYGITQIVVKPDNPNYEKALEIKTEYVIEAKGIVVLRESINKNIPTGDIEVIAKTINILNSAETPPIIVSDTDDANEEIRLKYRYLDLRKKKQIHFLLERSKIVKSIRNVLDLNGFVEVETPYLGKSTPEGARDYLVPSRIYPTNFYALPQSPQLYKQLLMIAGLEKYYQVAKCFRDEDLRADRQPEFTQIDIEASFIDQADIIDLSEKIMVDVFKVLGKTLTLPLPKITYQEALEKYGNDHPDTRYELYIQDFKADFKHVPLFAEKAFIRGLKVKFDPNVFTRKKIDTYTTLVKDNKGEMLAFVRKEDDKLIGSIAKFLEDVPLKNNEIIFLVAGEFEDISQALGALRRQIGLDTNLIDETKDNLLWITEWPLLTYDKEQKRFFAAHHPFTAPSDVKVLKDRPKDAMAIAYDLVWNGYEVAGGSIRIHEQKVQELMFETLGFSHDEIKDKFGFFVEALKYGTPPHGGIAFGLDRMVMLACHTSNIRDVIAFPKTQNARDLMMDAPNLVEDEQLKELGIKFK